MFVGALTLGFVNAIGPRIVQRFIPTPFDQAQIVSIGTQRQRLVDEDKRFERQMTEARARLLDELQHRKDMIELQEQLRRWQFDFLPAAFLKASEAAGGKALNIVIRLSDHRRVSVGDNDPATIILKDAVMAAEEQMIALYAGDRLFPETPETTPKNGVLFYADYRLGRELPVQSAVTALSSLLASEPVVLVDIAIRDGLRYRLTISHWGGAIGDAPQPVILPSQTLDLSAIAASEPERVSLTLSLTLTSLLVALSDNFHLLRHLWAKPQPAMPALMKFIRKYSGASVDWEGIFPVYRRSLDLLGDRAPAIATDIAADLALAIHAEGQHALAQKYLKQAACYFAAAYHQSEDFSQILQKLIRSSLNKEHPSLVEALMQVGGLKPEPLLNMRSKTEVYNLLVEPKK